MPRKVFSIVAGLGLIALIALTAGSERGRAATDATRTDGQAGTTVKAVYVTAASLKASPNTPLSGKVDPQQTIVFAITLDAHAGDLSRYDFVKNVVLRNDRGQQVAPVRWVATADGTHHREGGLVFPRTDQAGRAVEPQAKTLELVVRELGGVAERVLRWTLPLE